MEKIEIVKTHFVKKYKKVPKRINTGKKKKLLFGRTEDIYETIEEDVEDGYSDSIIDSNRLSEDLNKLITKLNEDGFEVVNITPIISGNYQYKWQAQGITSSKRLLSETEKVQGGASYGFGYGFSYTDSLLVHAKKV
jgi:hypothetical protein